MTYTQTRFPKSKAPASTKGGGKRGKGKGKGKSKRVKVEGKRIDKGQAVLHMLLRLATAVKQNGGVRNHPDQGWNMLEQVQYQEQPEEQGKKRTHAQLVQMHIDVQMHPPTVIAGWMLSPPTGRGGTDKVEETLVRKDFHATAVVTHVLQAMPAVMAILPDDSPIKKALAKLLLKGPNSSTTPLLAHHHDPLLADAFRNLERNFSEALQGVPCTVVDSNVLALPQTMRTRACRLGAVAYCVLKAGFYERVQSKQAATLAVFRTRMIKIAAVEYEEARKLENWDVVRREAKKFDVEVDADFFANVQDFADLDGCAFLKNMDAAAAEASYKEYIGSVPPSTPAGGHESGGEYSVFNA
jgi:hypothetical protein